VRRPRALGWWVAPLYLGMAVVLVPWIAVLARTLPDRIVSHNYRLAWVGFDVLLGLAMSRTAYLAWRRSPFVVNVASATAALLVVDAWFDVTTSPRREVASSIALAVLVELPAAALSLVIAARAQDVIARTGIRARRAEMLARVAWEVPEPGPGAAARTAASAAAAVPAQERQDSTSRVVNRAQASEPNTST